jgi:hypothetical protein
LGNQTIGFVEIISFDHDDVDKSSFTSPKLSKRRVNFYFGSSCDLFALLRRRRIVV